MNENKDEELPRMPFDDLEQFMCDVFVGCDVPLEDAKVCANVLITADKRGIDSHGIGRLKPIYYNRFKNGTLNPITNFEILRETPGTAVVDGHNGMGFIVAKKCMQMAIDKAKNVGIGMVVARHSTHYGIAGYYALQGAGQGCLTMNGCNARPSVAPTYGVENLIGTNPLCFGFPTNEEFPFVLDCATSITQRGKIEQWAREGKECPPNLVIKKDGTTMTDCNQILRELINGNAAFAPLGGISEDTGGHKGYGYGVVVEVLSAALQAGNFMKALSGFENDGKTPKPIELGHFFLAVNIEAFCPLEEFKANTSEILNTLRNSQRVPDQDRIYVAGEKELVKYKDRMEKGGCPIVVPLQKHMVMIRDELNLNQWHFSWEE